MATVVCFQIERGHRPAECDACGRMILRHEPRFFWISDARALEYENPPWNQRHVTCGSPCPTESEVAA